MALSARQCDLVGVKMPVNIIRGWIKREQGGGRGGEDFQKWVVVGGRVGGKHFTADHGKWSETFGTHWYAIDVPICVCGIRWTI